MFTTNVRFYTFDNVIVSEIRLNILNSFRINLLKIFNEIVTQFIKLTFLYFKNPQNFQSECSPIA